MSATDNTLLEVRGLLARVLQLGPKAAELGRQTGLLGNIPEVDSMAVVQVLTAIEEHFGVVVDDDEVSGDTFATLGSLADFVESKLAG
jgi:acyl carrier protein